MVGPVNIDRAADLLLRAEKPVMERNHRGLIRTTVWCGSGPADLGITFRCVLKGTRGAAVVERKRLSMVVIPRRAHPFVRRNFTGFVTVDGARSFRVSTRR